MVPRMQEVVTALPALRRYACALTGERRRGDEYILVALETLAHEPWRMVPDGDVKLQLYKLFHDVLSALSISDSDAPDDVDELHPHRELKRDLLDLPLLSRKLLLLVALERLSVVEAARIVQLPAHDVASRLASACLMLNRSSAAPSSGRMQKARESRMAM